MKIPFSPSVYEHAAALIGRSPWEVSRNPELLFAGHQAAYRKYHHTPVVVGVDIYNLEAEAYGAEVRVPGGNGIPAITQPLFEDVEQATQNESTARWTASWNWHRGTATVCWEPAAFLMKHRWKISNGSRNIWPNRE